MTAWIIIAKAVYFKSHKKSLLLLFWLTPQAYSHENSLSENTLFLSPNAFSLLAVSAVFNVNLSFSR